MGHVILLCRILTHPFLFILYKLQVTKVFYLAPNIIASGVILNSNIVPECIALKSIMGASRPGHIPPPPHPETTHFFYIVMV